MSNEVEVAVGIESKNFAIRGKRAMLDSDLAFLYLVETKALNQAVRRNAERFPDDFMFRLTYDETRHLMRSQIVTASADKRNKTAAPYAFTEQGVAMLSAVLRSDRAVQVSILIMRVFSRLRQLAVDNQDLRMKIEELEKRCDGQFAEIFNAIANLSNDAEGGGPMGFSAR